jgi:Flp pilus assembly protein TadD
MAGDAAAALPVATEALRLAPASADAHDLMGVVLGVLGRRAESTAEH